MDQELVFSMEHRWPMTYNFDPDQWFDIQKALLEKKLKEGKTSRQEFDDAIQDLEEQYYEMWKRLDGYFQIPED
ncbi:MAG: hypothetical protein KJ645_02765 [Planctomycetes bacterium]|nr:hypothetical protein [Planctomycetota bacterium]